MQPMTWLVAEDESDIRILITMMLQMMGHTIVAFESGQKVWDWLDRLEHGDATGPLPDFVLMDIRMPGKKGNEVAQRMRTLPLFRDRPIVLMTAYSLTEAERQAMKREDGVDEVLAKPLPDFDELQALLQRIHTEKQPATPPTDDSP